MTRIVSVCLLLGACAPMTPEQDARLRQWVLVNSATAQPAPVWHYPVPVVRPTVDIVMPWPRN